MKTFFVSFALVAQTLAALGTTVSTPASIATRGLRMVITKYLANGGDINELKMEQVLQMVDIDAANSTAQGKFEDRFEILGGSGPVDKATTARMIAYTSNRIGEDRRAEPGRYVIWLADGEVNYNWESEEKVAELLDNAGMKMVDRGPWTQPDTKAQSMFHVGVGPQPPPDDNRVQEDQAGRRLSIPNAKNQNDPQQSTEQQPGTISDPRNTPDAKSSPKEPEAKPQAPSEEPTSSRPWSIIVVLIVAATGLLWLLVKKQR
jgi:hypothetical protein